MGVRAAPESVMIDRVGDRGKFVANIDAFQKAGYLSERQRGTLDAVLGAGYAAIHRGWEPTNEDARTLVDIAEGLIEEFTCTDRERTFSIDRFQKDRQGNDRSRLQIPSLIAWQSVAREIIEVKDAPQAHRLRRRPLKRSSLSSMNSRA
jgi:hypothetical protein